MQRAMRELVDGSRAHLAWSEAAAGLIRPSAPDSLWQAGSEWQEAIRQEWQSQQLLRAASLQRVTKVEAAWPYGVSYWVANDPLFTHCYLITQTSNKSLHLLDPSQTPPMLKPLQLAPRNLWAFCLPNGRLRIVELVGQPSKASLCWHTISLIDGSTLASEHKHYWPRRLLECKLSLIYHAESSKVFGLVDSHTLAIMHADTLHEVTRFCISSRHPQHIKEGFGVLADLAWSLTGSLMAVVWQGARHVTAAEAVSDRRTQLYAGPPIVSEVHVFDLSSGHCLQSIAVSAGSIKLCWSPGNDMLAVYSRQDDWSGDEQVLRYPIDRLSESDSEGDDGCWNRSHNPGSGISLSSSSSRSDEDRDLDDEDDSSAWSHAYRGGAGGSGCAHGSNMTIEGYYSTRVPRFMGQIRLLRPLQAQLHVLDCQQIDHSQAQWTRCDWSPQGHLLAAQWGSNSKAEAAGFVIIDAVSCQTIFEADQPAGNISWAEQPLSLQELGLVAFLSGARKTIGFSRLREGGWRAVPCTRPEFSPGSKVYTSPDGKKLVGLQPSSRAFKQGHICHVALRSSSQEQTLDLEGPSLVQGTDWDITFAPFPRWWPALYAYVHPVPKARQPEQQAWAPGRAQAQSPLLELSLVDCQRNVVLGSWTAQDLWQQSTRRRRRAPGSQDGAQLKLHSAKWSPDRRHLAVICNRCTMVMTFDKGNELE